LTDSGVGVKLEPDALGKNEVMENCYFSLNKRLDSRERGKKGREQTRTRDSFFGGERELVDARAIERRVK